MSWLPPARTRTRTQPRTQPGSVPWLGIKPTTPLSAGRRSCQRSLASRGRSLSWFLNPASLARVAPVVGALSVRTWSSYRVLFLLSQHLSTSAPKDAFLRPSLFQRAVLRTGLLQDGGQPALVAECRATGPAQALRPPALTGRGCRPPASVFALRPKPAGQRPPGCAVLCRALGLGGQPSPTSTVKGSAHIEWAGPPVATTSHTVKPSTSGGGEGCEFAE